MSTPTIIITGASQGLGAAMAQVAAARGAQVVLAARSEVGLDAQRRKIEQLGGAALAVTADITRPDDCRRIVDGALRAYGKVDALINNAATIEPLAGVADLRVEDWSYQMAVNVFGPLMLSQLTIPHLRRTRGRIVNVTSQGADIVIPGASAYGASKAALNRLSKTLAAEEPDSAVLLFVPGEVDTAMQAVIREKGKGQTPDEIHQFFVDLHEQGQLLPPQTPAQAGVALALDAPHAWSGEVLQWDDERVQQLVGSL